MFTESEQVNHPRELPNFLRGGNLSSVLTRLGNYFDSSGELRKSNGLRLLSVCCPRDQNSSEERCVGGHRLFSELVSQLQKAQFSWLLS